MSLKIYLVVIYAILVRAERFVLDPVEGDPRPAVPEEYRFAVLEYLSR